MPTSDTDARARAEAVEGRLVAIERLGQHGVMPSYWRTPLVIALAALVAELDARTAALQDAREALREIAELPRTRRHPASGEWETTPLLAAQEIARAVLARLDGGREHHEKET